MTLYKKVLQKAIERRYKNKLIQKRLVLRPKNSNLLEILVSQINSDNLHKGIDTDKRVGNEEW